MARYPQRINQPNGFEIAGATLRDLGGQVGEHSDRQQKLRSHVQSMIDKRREKILADMAAQDEARRKDAELKFRQDEATRKANEPVKYVPTTQEEHLKVFGEEEKIRNQHKPAPKPSDGDISRQQRRTKALKSIPLIWSEIKTHQEQIPQRIDPADEGWNNWVKRARELKGKLNQEELEAGINPSTAIAGNLNDNPSYRLYMGMNGADAAPEASAPAPSPRPARGPLDELAAAEDWLARNPNNPIAAQVKAKIDSLRAGGQRGL